MKKLFSFTIMLAFLASCQKLTNDNIIPDGEPRLTDIQQQYKNQLVASENGWYIEYAADADKGVVSVWMKFFDDGRVLMQSDLYNFTQELTSTYRIGGVNRPELIFDTYSVWSVIAEEMGGEFEFHIYPKEDGNFTLRHIFQDSDKPYTLRKATANDHQNILDKTATAELLSRFESNSSAYFKNLVLENITAFWEIRVDAQSIRLTWEDAQNREFTEQLAYSNLPNGIRFSTPWKPNGLEIRELIFGDATDSELAVVSAGNGGAGRVEVGHIPAFPYKNAAERYIFSNLNKTNEETVRFLGYTVNEDAISDALRPYYDAVANALPTFWRIQVYNLSPVATPRNAIALVGKNDQGGNVWSYFYYQLDKVDDSHVRPTYQEASVDARPIENHPDVRAFLDAIYPPEGVTIEPLSGQKLRVISRKNSLHYMELTVSTPAGIWRD